MRYDVLFLVLHNKNLWFYMMHNQWFYMMCNQWLRLGVILPPSWGYLGVTLGLFRGYLGVTLGFAWGYHAQFCPFLRIFYAL